MKYVLFVICVAVLLVCSGTYAAETVHLTLTGATQGLIKGESTQESVGRADTIECMGYTHIMEAQLDNASQPTGKNNHHPISILKRIDKASVHLFRAMRNAESCTAVFKFYRPSPVGDGTTQQFYTVTLTGARISGIRQEVPSTVDPVTDSMPVMERISFTYGTIVETYTVLPDGYEYGDDWHCATTRVPFSDVNFDGVVNMKDYAIMADDWLTQY